MTKCQELPGASPLNPGPQRAPQTPSSNFLLPSLTMSLASPSLQVGSIEIRNARVPTRAHSMRNACGKHAEAKW